MGGRTSSRPLARSVSRVRKALLVWYDDRRRPLPWRRDRNPYKIWVAEVMLQQTRIAVVVPAYERFLHAFPNLSKLAAADEDAVLSLGSGLGYYSRARALHRAARQLRAEGRRAFPRSMAEARQLPGVGAYTAAAVLSIAYDQPHAAVDGNVVRVLSRLRKLGAPNGRGDPQRSVAAALLDRARPGDWNQALMELGETVCLPKAPQCESCPLRGHCDAFGAGTVDRYPVRAAGRPTERVDLELLLLHDAAGRMLLERGAFRYLPHLWLPPFRHAGTDMANTLFSRADAIGSFRHAIVHRSFSVDVFQRAVANRELHHAVRRAEPGAGERRVFEPSEIGKIGRSSLLTKAMKRMVR
jgi:A/G-specific adenine glycosylase